MRLNFLVVSKNYLNHQYIDIFSLFNRDLGPRSILWQCQLRMTRCILSRELVKRHVTGKYCRNGQIDWRLITCTLSNVISGLCTMTWTRVYSRSQISVFRTSGPLFFVYIFFNLLAFQALTAMIA